MSALARGKSIFKKQVVIGNHLLKPVVHGKTLPKRRLSHIRASFPTSSNVNISAFPSFGPQYSTKLITDQAVPNSLQERAFSSESVLFPQEVDLSSISLGPPKKGKAGQLFVPIEYGGRKMRIQSPALRTPFGASRYRTEKGEELGPLTIQLALENVESNPKVKALYDFINKVDDKVLAYVRQNSKLLFPGKNYLPDSIDGLFTRSIKSSKDFAPVLRLKVDVAKGEPAINVYLHDDPAPIEALTPNSTIVTIFEPRSIYLIWSGGFGVTWYVRQVKITNRPTYALDANAFREDAPELQNVSPKPRSPNPRPPVAEDQVSPSQREEVDALLEEKSADDIISEEDEGEELVEEVKPAKPIAKAAVKPSTFQSAPKMGVKTATAPIKQVPVKAVPVKAPVKQAIPMKQTSPIKQTVATSKVIPAVPTKTTVPPKKK